MSTTAEKSTSASRTEEATGRGSRRARVPAIVVAALAVTGIGLVLASTSEIGHAAAWGLAATAVLLGARHAFDADHIAVIDNVTRRLATTDENRRAVVPSGSGSLSVTRVSSSSPRPSSLPVPRPPAASSRARIRGCGRSSACGD
ncbi:hypothetical protein IOD13_14555 [Brevibacterium casei]|nr:hypothetical protein [Brevibacterium casei]